MKTHWLDLDGVIHYGDGYRACCIETWKDRHSQQGKNVPVIAPLTCLICLGLPWEDVEIGYTPPQRFKGL